MAGDWIKMRSDLRDDPAVITMAARLKMDEQCIVGRLHTFWSWVDRQSRDGRASIGTHAWLDRYVSTPGFAEAMIAVGWLTLTGDGLSIPNFDRHNGETAKARALNTRNKQLHRAVDVPLVSLNDRDNSATREEKRREERKKETPTESPKKSARDRIEEFTPTEADRAWAAKKAPSVPVDIETEAWRDRVRAANYRTKQGAIADPAASWRTSFRNAEAWGTYRKKWESRNTEAPPTVRVPSDAERELDETRDWIGAQGSAVLAWKKHGSVPADWPVAECTPDEWEAYRAHVKEAGVVTLAEWRNQERR